MTWSYNWIISDCYYSIYIHIYEYKFYIYTWYQQKGFILILKIKILLTSKLNVDKYLNV